MAYSKFNKYPSKTNLVSNTTIQNNLYPVERLDLDLLNVYIEDTDSEYFQISKLPEQIGYGKHGFFVSTIANFKNNTEILLEVKDSEDKIIFSDIAEFKPINDSVLCYLWIRKDPVRIYDEISNGIGTITLVGTLEDVPLEWQNTINVKYIQEINIQKSVPNNSPLIFKQNPSVNIAETVERDTNLTGGKVKDYKRDYINFLFRNLDVYSGELEYIEIYENSSVNTVDSAQLVDRIKIEKSPELYRGSYLTGSHWMGNLNDIETIFTGSSGYPLSSSNVPTSGSQYPISGSGIDQLQKFYTLKSGSYGNAVKDGIHEGDPIWPSIS